MNTIKNLAKSSIKANKSKSILSIVAIILTTCLLTSVGIIAGDWIESNKQNAIDRAGQHHVVFKRSTGDQIKKLSNHVEIEQLEVVKTIGSYDKNDANLRLQFIGAKDDKHINVSELKEGELPQKENEIAISEGYMTTLGKSEPNVGDTITIEYQSIKDGELKNREFVVCGVVTSTEDAIQRKTYAGVVSEDYFIKEEYSNDLTFTTYGKFIDEGGVDVYSVEEELNKIIKNFGIDKYDTSINKDYLNSISPDMTVVGSAFLIVILIVISSVIVIYNIFYIGVTNKVQEYGKLRAIGATKRQIKKLLLKEGMTLATIAIPIGLLIGYGVSKFVILKMIEVEVPQSSYTLPILIGSVIISYFTVFISILKPMRVASKISSVEAMRYNGNDNNKQKFRKGYEEMNISRLTKANLSRNKKRTVVTIISLSLSGILFIVASTIMSSISVDKMTKLHMGEGKFNIRLSGYSLETGEDNYLNLRDRNPITNYIEFIENLDGVTGIEAARNTLVKYVDTDEWWDISYINNSKVGENEKISEVVSGEIDLDKLKNDGIILNHSYSAEVYGINVGDKIKLEIVDGDVRTIKELQVMAITDGHGASLVIHEDLYNNLFTMDTNSMISVMADDNKYDEIKAQIKNIENQDSFISAEYYDEVASQNILAVGVTKVMAYALVIIIGLIGLINLINTMITSVLTRKKELGMLQAIGLSDKQLISMIQKEGLFYTVTTLSITLTLGNIIAYIAYTAFKNAGASYAEYSYPVVPTVILIVAILATQLLIAYLISSNFNKQSLIDRVRYSE